MKFHGLLIYMSIVRRQQGLSSYWDNDASADTVCRKHMTRRRFLSLMRFFHAVSHTDEQAAASRPRTSAETTTTPSSRGAKVSKWLDMLSSQATTVWEAHDTVCLDECMILGKQQRHPIKVRDGSKPIPFGTKLWMLVDATGVLLWSKIYEGARGQERTVGLGFNIVAEALSWLRRPGHTIYMDNFYSSFSSMMLVRELGHHGVLMLRRSPASAVTWNPVLALTRMAKEQKITRGQWLAMWHRDTGIMVQLWKDNMFVSVMSCCHDCHCQESCRRRDKAAPGGVADIPVPPAVQAYNNHKGHVDNNNKLRETCKLWTQFRRWWVRVFFQGVWASAEVNAWQACRWHQKTALSFPQFRLELALELLGTPAHPQAQPHRDAVLLRAPGQTCCSDTKPTLGPRGKCYCCCSVDYRGQRSSSAHYTCHCNKIFHKICWYHFHNKQKQ